VSVALPLLATEDFLVESGLKRRGVDAAQVIFSFNGFTDTTVFRMPMSKGYYIGVAVEPRSYFNLKQIVIDHDVLPYKLVNYVSGCITVSMVATAEFLGLTPDQNIGWLNLYSSGLAEIAFGEDLNRAREAFVIAQDYVTDEWVTSGIIRSEY
jgi:hypothetical protein